MEDLTKNHKLVTTEQEKKEINSFLIHNKA